MLLCFKEVKGEPVQTSLTYFYLKSLVVAGPQLHCFPLIAPSSGAKQLLPPTTRPIMSFHSSLVAAKVRFLQIASV